MELVTIFNGGYKHMKLKGVQKNQTVDIFLHNFHIFKHFFLKFNWGRSSFNKITLHSVSI